MLDAALKRTGFRQDALIVDDPLAVRSTIYRLHEFAEICPDVLIVPSHCPEAFQEEVEANDESI